MNKLTIHTHQTIHTDTYIHEFWFVLFHSTRKFKFLMTEITVNLYIVCICNRMWNAKFELRNEYLRMIMPYIYKFSLHWYLFWFLYVFPPFYENNNSHFFKAKQILVVPFIVQERKKRMKQNEMKRCQLK